MLRYLVLLCLFASSSFAEEALIIAPTRLIFEPNQKADTLTVTNRSNRPRRYVLNVVDQIMQPDGSIIDAESFPYSAKRMLRFSPRTLSLVPGQRLTVRVVARRPAGLADGDYHTHIFFQEEEIPQSLTDEQTASGLKIKINTTVTVAIPVIVQHGKLQSSVALSKVTKESNDKGQERLNVALTRSGNAEGNIWLLSHTTSVSGTQVKATEPKNLRIYREADNVTVALPVLASAKGQPLTFTLSKTMNAKPQDIITQVQVP